MGIYMGDLLATAARAQTFWNSDAQACTVCLGRDQRSTDALRSWDLRCLTLYSCAREVFEREKEREPFACIYPSATNGEAPTFLQLMLRIVQTCLSTVQTEALPLLNLRCPGLIQMCLEESNLHV